MATGMKVRIVVAVFASVLISGLTSRAEAEGRCTNASLKGSYAFNVDGASVSNPYLFTGPFAAVGKNTYDGKGQLKGVIVISSNGTIITASFTGTYAVSANCTGVKSATLSTGAVVEFFFAIDDNLREIRMVVTRAGIPGSLVDGVTVSGSARKLDANNEDR